MIARSWRGRCHDDAATAYLAHLRSDTLPRLRRLDGHRGVYVLQRPVGDQIEFVVLTLWDSMKSVRAFAGDDYEAAVVPPEARRVLSSFDERVLHYEVVMRPDGMEGAHEG